MLVGFEDALGVEVGDLDIVLSDAIHCGLLGFFVSNQLDCSYGLGDGLMIDFNFTPLCSYRHLNLRLDQEPYSYSYPHNHHKRDKDNRHPNLHA